MKVRNYSFEEIEGLEKNYQTLIPKLLKKKRPITQIVNYFTKRIIDRDTRNKHKKIIYDIYHDICKENSEVKETNKFYEKIGINLSIKNGENNE